MGQVKHSQEARAMPETTDLSQRQQRILATIREFTVENGYPPTIRQLGEAVGISSTSVVSYNLAILQRKGHLSRDREVSRGLRLSEEQEADTVRIPVLGAIAAGEPIPVPEGDFAQVEQERVALTRDMVGGQPEQVYALQVRGYSMIDALINDGDLVIMRHQNEAENGDMVAAWLKDEKATTLKRFYWEKDRARVRLQPANPTMEPIYVHPSNLEIQGKVIGVIRHVR
jgi:repressor LexA